MQSNLTTLPAGHAGSDAGSTSGPASNPAARVDDAQPAGVTDDSVIVEIDDLSFSYDHGESEALSGISLGIRRNQVTAFIGPSGCGKSTLLRCLNRMNDLIDTAKVTRGTIKIHGRDIYAPDVDPIEVRKQVGMVFQKYNPFPMSIFENVAYGLRIGGEKNKEALDAAVERSLKQAALWDEVKDRLGQSALGLSGGQQQRLCIARAIAVQPRIVLMDEPCSALDPIATTRIEELITHLVKDYTIVIVTHNMQQATRVSNRTAFFYLGKLIEYEDTETIFGHPREKQTEDYVSGRFG